MLGFKFKLVTKYYTFYYNNKILVRYPLPAHDIDEDI